MIIKLTDEVLKTIEFAVESRIDLESDEQCTLIASAELIQAIKIAIAKGEIFQNIYSRLILQENPSIIDPYQITIVPDSIIESAIQDQIKDHLAHNEDVQKKLRILNEKLASIDEETLSRISLSDEETLSKEDLELKASIQSQMLEVGLNVDLMFSNKGKEKSKFTEEAVDKIFEKVADENTTISLKGLVKNEE